jgi:hypothetical protein
MKGQDESAAIVRKDTAVAAAALIMEEFFPHCTNGLVAPIGERLSDIVEAAIEAAFVLRAKQQNEPSLN